MFSKVLVANRGEIAVRAFRAAVELGARTVAVFPYEDRNAVHRIKADESYLIGERGHPVCAYLDVDEIVRVARECGADAVYPGYGFLSENPRLAEACEAAGIAFVGPPPAVLSLAGNKVKALAAAREAGIPVLRSSAPSSDLDELVTAADISAGSSTRRMPRPPPPATALTNTGNGMPSTAASTVSRSSLGSVEASTGRPAPRAAAIARALLPVSVSTSAGGPTKAIPARAHSSARSGFSDRNP